MTTIHLNVGREMPRIRPHESFVRLSWLGCNLLPHLTIKFMRHIQMMQTMQMNMNGIELELNNTKRSTK